MDFLSQSIREYDNGMMIGTIANTMEIPRKPSDFASLDRSAGSPDSLRSETSIENPDSITNMLLSLQKQADVISDVKETGIDKPEHSYIALIFMAILSSKEKKIILGEIYEFIMTQFPYYNNQMKAWRNSIRHNLSINECFIKNGRADNGKGNYWSIHPACVEDFAKGDFRRRQARRRARKGIKDVNRHQFYESLNPRSFAYVPMTSSSFGYQPMTSSRVGCQPLISSQVGHQSTSALAGNQLMTQPSLMFEPLASSAVTLPRIVTPTMSHVYSPSPLKYQPMTSQAGGFEPYRPTTSRTIEPFQRTMSLDTASYQTTARVSSNSRFVSWY